MLLLMLVGVLERNDAWYARLVLDVARRRIVAIVTAAVVAAASVDDKRCMRLWW